MVASAARISDRRSEDELPTQLPSTHQVVVSGIGIVAPGCRSRTSLWEHLIHGRSQLRLFPDPAFPERQIAMGRLNDEEERLVAELPDKICHRWSLEQRIHLCSLLRARTDAGLDRDPSISPDRIGIFDGTSRANLSYLCERLEQRTHGRSFSKQDLALGIPNHAAALAASLLGVRGPVLTVGVTCASGAVAIGWALRAIERGEIDVAYASGHDTPLVAPIYETYHSAGLLSREAEDAGRALRPFVDASGTVFGEGSVTLVIESREHAASRGAEPLASITDFVHGNTGGHSTHVDVSGELPARFIAGLLRRNRVTPEDIGFVLAHGNGTPMTYASEIGLMKRLFKARSAAVPLLSTKPIFGHMMGAASALDVAAATLMVQCGRTFSTINVDRARVPDGVRHHSAEFAPGRVRRGLAMSYGMGGQISAMLIEQPTPHNDFQPREAMQ
jgi:3-oxoacyl-[acyl-carrier-protein] synthase II